MSKFTKGDTVYNLDGQQGAYIASYGGTHLVAPEFEDHDTGEPHWGRPEEWREVFHKPPTAKLEARVNELDKLVNEKRAELRRVNEELDQAGKRRQEQLKKIGQHRALQRIEDYLDGKFTHFLEVSDYYGPKIVTADDALANGGIDRWDKGIRLLTLFGDTKGDLQWRINRYSDGSGSSSTEVFPCHTEEEAIDIVRRLFSAAVVEWREQEKKHYGRAVNWANKCPDGWIEVPEDLAAYLAEQKLAAHNNAVEKAREALAEAEAKLAALMAGPTTTSSVRCDAAVMNVQQEKS